ncbi:MAG: CehA/McbA family metallohydrolase [Syntrophomonadaceae bacterium]|nr:CehA/McbA family metallohydrolase [Syntrophomonadaceae bacterium]
MWEYIANLHVHTNYSDGSGSVRDIVHAAENAGIDVVGITDHSTLAAWERGEEGWHGAVFVLVGVEINQAINHYLAFGIENLVADDDALPQNVINKVHQMGGIGFIAHPYEKGSPLIESGRSFPWTDWQVKDYTGICIWNYTSQWRDSIRSASEALWRVYIAPNNPIKSACPGALWRWDQENLKRQVVAIGGSDAHAVQVKYGPFKPVIFPYEFLFRCINTHILTGTPLAGNHPNDRQILLTALAQGHCFIAFDYYYPARGFRFQAVNDHQLLSVMGDTCPLSPGVALEVALPYPGEIRLIKNGQLTVVQKGSKAGWRIAEPGVYRVEVWKRVYGLKSMAWIYSNPIYVC